MLEYCKNFPKTWPKKIWENWKKKTIFMDWSINFGYNIWTKSGFEKHEDSDWELQLT